MEPFRNMRVKGANSVLKDAGSRKPQTVRPHRRRLSTFNVRRCSACKWGACADLHVRPRINRSAAPDWQLPLNLEQIPLAHREHQLVALHAIDVFRENVAVCSE